MCSREQILVQQAERDPQKPQEALVDENLSFICNEQLFITAMYHKAAQTQEYMYTYAFLDPTL